MSVRWRSTKRLPVYSVAVLTVLLHSSLAQPVTAWQWQQQEVADFFAGAAEVRVNGWGRLNAKVNKVVQQLVSYSGMIFRVVPAETGRAGEAHNGGWILLDLSIVVNDSKRVEFWLAHEWGHEALGHSANYVHPTGGSWHFTSSTTGDTSNEDAADEYAGRFLCVAGYPLRPVLNMLTGLPLPAEGDSHSSGLVRARTVTKAYNSTGCSEDSPTGGSALPPVVSPPSKMCSVACTHPAHPNGDIFPCAHPAHPLGDAIPCTHVCQGPYGLFPCHQFDSIQCTHRVHLPGDISPCTHPAHYGGDVVVCSN
jgi:hypothetical protein